MRNNGSLLTKIVGWEYGINIIKNSEQILLAVLHVFHIFKQCKASKKLTQIWHFWPSGHASSKISASGGGMCPMGAGVLLV